MQQGIQFNYKDEADVQLGRYFATLLRLPCTFGAGYLMFGTPAIGLLTDAVSPYPWLEITTFCGLAMIPFLMAKFEVLNKSIDAVIQNCAVLVQKMRGKYSSLAHCMMASRQPVGDIVKSILYFFALNLFVNAVPETFAMPVPKMLRFLDADGDGTLEAAEIEEWVYRKTSMILVAVFNTHFIRYLLKVKKPPYGWNPRDARDARYQRDYPESFLSKYWIFTSKKAGWWTLLDRIITGLLVIFVGYTWIVAAGIDPKAVAAAGGAGGLAIGLAAQAVVGNGVAALIILATAPCAVGDRVEVGMPDLRYEGVVTEIGWNATAILDESGDMPCTVYVPNGIMLQTPLVVYQHEGDEANETSPNPVPVEQASTPRVVPAPALQTPTPPKPAPPKSIPTKAPPGRIVYPNNSAEEKAQVLHSDAALAQMQVERKVAPPNHKLPPKVGIDS